MTDPHLTTPSGLTYSVDLVERWSAPNRSWNPRMGRLNLK